MEKQSDNDVHSAIQYKSEKKNKKNKKNPNTNFPPDDDNCYYCYHF